MSELLHTSTEALAAYVMGDADDASVAAVDAHLSSCAACRDRLADEARLELALYEVAAHAEPPAGPLVHPPVPRVERPLLSLEPPRRSRVLLPAIVAGTATAALIAVGVLRVNDAPAPPPAEPAVVAEPPFEAPPATEPAVRAPETASLHVFATPWARVFVDGESVGVTPLRLQVAPGRHEMVLVDRGERARKRMSVHVEPGETRRVSHRFDATLPDRGREVATEGGELEVRALPWAKVYVDGKSVGTTPLSPVTLAPGSYRVRFENPALGARERVVQVERGKRAQVRVDMRRTR